MFIISQFLWVRSLGMAQLSALLKVSQAAVKQLAGLHSHLEAVLGKNPHPCSFGLWAEFSSLWLQKLSFFIASIYSFYKPPAVHLPQVSLGFLTEWQLQGSLLLPWWLRAPTQCLSKQNRICATFSNLAKVQPCVPLVAFWLL